MEDLPKTTKGVIIDENDKLSYGEIPLPEMEEEEVLIKIHSAPINPSDLSFARGRYPAGKTKPTAVGFEGSGLVIAAGSNEKCQALLNKRVCFFAKGKRASGSWGEFSVVDLNSVMPLPESLSYEEGASCLVNPLTVEGFLHTSEKNGVKCIIHSAAASQVGRMLIAGAKETGIKLINVVRRQEQVDIIKELGAEEALIINTGEEDWKEKAQAIFDEHQPGAFFDAVAGEVANEIVRMMPPKSTTYNYGALSLTPISVSSIDLIFKLKVVTGWWLSDYVRSPENVAVIFPRTFERLAKKIFKTEVAQTFSHEKYGEAIEFYKNNMTKGKVLLQNPNF